MLRFLTAYEHAVLAAAADRLIPPLDAHPGGAELGVADYVDRLLGAFTFEPPLIFAGGPFSGRAGGEASFDRFLPLSRHEELAWRTRIEGSLGIPEREFNGPTRGWQQIYRDGVAALGVDFVEVDGDEQDHRLRAQRELPRALLHACLRGRVRTARVRRQPRRSGLARHPVPRRQPAARVHRRRGARECLIATR